MAADVENDENMQLYMESFINDPDTQNFVGRGSFGLVYKLRLPNKDRTVAIKIISNLDDNENIIANEVTIQKKLAHPNVLSCLMSVITKHHIGVIMDYADRGSLLDRIKQTEYSLENGEILHYTKQIIAGLNYLHKKGIIHRDVRSPNLLLFSDNANMDNNLHNLKIADYGLSKLYKPDSLKGSKFSTDVGNPYWKSPEQMNDKIGQPGSKVDSWSLGITVLEMHYGNKKAPEFQMEWYSYCYELVRQKKVPETPLFSSNILKSILESCLVYDPEKRYSVSQLYDSYVVLDVEAETVSPIGEHNIVEGTSSNNEYINELDVCPQVKLPTDKQATEERYDDSWMSEPLKRDEEDASFFEDPGLDKLDISARENSVTWCEHANTYLGGYSSGTYRYDNLASAQEACIIRGDCGGITQESATRYTLRRGADLRGSPSGETSWLVCEAGSTVSGVDKFSEVSLTTKHTVTKPTKPSKPSKPGKPTKPTKSVVLNSALKGFLVPDPTVKFTMKSVRMDQDGRQSLSQFTKDSPAGKTASPSKSDASPTTHPPTAPQSNWKNKLQEYCQKSGLLLPAYTTNNVGNMQEPRFTSTVALFLDDDVVKHFTSDVRGNAKSADMHAAELAYKAMGHLNRGN